jgi:hypothetical protein
MKHLAPLLAVGDVGIDEETKLRDNDNYRALGCGAKGFILTRPDHPIGPHKGSSGPTTTMRGPARIKTEDRLSS